jgi:phage head maturation protease
MSKLRKYPTITRSVPVSDMDISRDGRTVIAYAATFGHAYPVRDFDGDYDETINRTAFNRHLSQHGLRNVSVIFNHGLTAWNTPSEMFSQPLGAPLDVRPDGKGLLTITRYNKTQWADNVLEMWRNGDVKAQSFRGPIIRSGARTRGANGRTQIERLELGLREYGPAPAVANTEAELVALRSAMLLEQFDELSDEDRAHLRTLLDGTPLEDPLSTAGTPLGDSPAPLDDPTGTGSAPPADDTSINTLILANAQRRRRTS